MLAALRATLHAHDFLEVETPILQPVHGGANARPFVTHINAYDLTMYLRIAPELYLKRLAVGGVDRVFELGRTFRNEGVDATHNPEFTMLEAYQAYADYTTMRALAQQLIVRRRRSPRSVSRCCAGPTVPGWTCPGSGRWSPVNEAMSRAAGLDGGSGYPGGAAGRARGPGRGGRCDPSLGCAAQIVLELYEQLVEHATGQPTFYIDFPTEVSPLTRAHRRRPAAGRALGPGRASASSSVPPTPSWSTRWSSAPG